MPPEIRPRLVVFDLAVTRTSPAGSCVRTELAALAGDWDITVFSDALDNPAPGRIRHLRVPLPARPVALRYPLFHVLAGLRYAAWRLRHPRPDLIQATQGQFPGAAVVYAHFCHRAYLQGAWRRASALGVRRVLRGFMHRYNAAAEARALRRARRVVVPSRGLAREIAATYPGLRARVEVIPNPVDVAAYARPAGHDRAAMRDACGFTARDVVIVFVALGDFARKGLRLLIEALAGGAAPGVKLLVVGGQRDEVARFRGFAAQEGVDGRVHFAGLQGDIRPWLWAADALALPSAYETFSLVAHQAAAAGLPVIAAPVHGVEDMLEDGVNGFVIARSVPGIRAGLERLLAARPGLPALGEHARAAVARRCAPDAFGARWRAVLESLIEPRPSRPPAAPVSAPARVRAGV